MARDFGFLPSVHRDVYFAHRLVAQSYRELGFKKEESSEYRAARDYYSNLPHNTADDYYNLACIASLCSSSEQEKNSAVAADPEVEAEHLRNVAVALSALQDAVKLGFANLAMIRADTDLDPIRNLDEFKAIVSRLEKIEKAEQLAEQSKRLAPEARLQAEREVLASRKECLQARPRVPLINGLWPPATSRSPSLSWM